MFNKLKQTKTDKPQTQDANLDAGKEVLTEQVPVTGMQSANASNKPSIISEGAVYEGNMSFKGILHLDGQFKGDIKVDKLTIGKSGSFKGKIEADAVIVFGELKGELDCRDLALNSGSSVDGLIKYASIKIQPGSSVSGELHCMQMQKDV